MLDYKKLGMKCGIEIHQRLDTHKLFCDCDSGMGAGSSLKVARRLRAVAGELGDVDPAALHEIKKGGEFHYDFYPGEDCLVELDAEPPHELNAEALDIALEVALMLKCDIPNEIHVMRKTVIDGSNTSGFQRTAIVGLDGSLKTKSGSVGITNVCVEEESAQILGREKGSVRYGLNRLGIPLVEIGTSADIKTPEHAREVAERLGEILRATGKVQRGLGTIRQDLNVSVKGGSRVEIKGVQDIKSVPRIIEGEVKRQLGIIKRGGNVKEEVRKAEVDGTTSYLRPLPGAARMYPETDIPPIAVTAGRLWKLKEEVRKISKLHERDVELLVKMFKVDRKHAEQLKRSGRLGGEDILRAKKLIEMFPKIDGGLIWNAVVEIPKDIKKRHGVNTDNLTDDHFVEFFKLLEKGKIKKEAAPDILREFALNPSKKIGDIVKKLKLETISEKELKDIVRNVIKKNPQALKAQRPEKALMGLVMKEVRGRAPGNVVMRVLGREIRKLK